MCLIVICSYLSFFSGFPHFQVTEQVRASVEGQVEAAREQYKQLEQKHMEVDKEKHSLQEERNRAVAEVEQKVMTFIVLLPFRLIHMLINCIFIVAE